MLSKIINVKGTTSIETLGWRAVPSVRLRSGQTFGLALHGFDVFPVGSMLQSARPGPSQQEKDKPSVSGIFCCSG